MRPWIGTVLLMFAWLLSGPALASEPVRIDFYGHHSCSHCAAAQRYLDRLEREDPSLEIHRYDVGDDPSALAHLQALHGEGPIAVPVFDVEGRLLIGFRSPEVTGPELASLIAAARAELEQADASPEHALIDLPLVGEVDPRALGLPMFTIVIAAIDGFNPCATWVLLFLLSLLVKLSDRRRVLLIGGTFVLVSGLVYFAFMAAWLQVYVLIGISRAVEIVLGLIAVTIGALDIKDFVAFGKGPKLGIPEQAKPTIYRRARAVIQAHSTLAALFAATVLALLVNVVELLCTAGLPAIYTQVLTAHDLPVGQRYAYLGLYNLVYMLDDLILLVIAVVTLRRTKLQERGGRILKLIAGLVILVLGLVMLFAPRALSW